MKTSFKIVFLYSELATYFLSCVDALIATGEVEVHLVRWPLNNEAPFDFNFNRELNVYDRKNYTNSKLIELVEGISPDLIFCSGWMDKGYKQICKLYKKKIPVVLGMDNHWKGTVKQRLAVLLSPILIRRFFNFIWVPGTPQEKYARKLGFRSEKILTGYYSADVSFFNNYYTKFHTEKEKNFPKRFIYVGRYLSFKGINYMWDAFIELQKENPNEWELWCLGTGAEYDQRKEHEKIKHFGFVQPEEIPKFIEQTGVFILPSIFEPWGVVIHEFAASGFPIITTEHVGSAESYVENGVNGFIVKPAIVSELKNTMKKFVEMTNSELNQMADASHQIAQKNSPEIWSTKLLRLLK